MRPRVCTGNSECMWVTSHVDQSTWKQNAWFQNYVYQPYGQHHFFIVQFSSVSQLCQTLFNPMDCSTPGCPVHHQLLELAQTQVHQVSDVIQPSHPLLSPSPPAFNLSQHQGLSQRVSSSHQVAKYWNFSFSVSLSNGYLGLISFRMDWSDLLAVQGTLVFSNNTVQKHQFFGIQFSL